MTALHQRGLLDTSTVIALQQLADPGAIPAQPEISTMTLAELSVGPLVAPTRREQAARQALSGPAGWPGVQLTRGKEVVELSVLAADKGTALRRLRRELASDVVIYAGDDTTDEWAFAVLDDEAGDVTVKVGAGESVARHRLRGPDDVARMLDHLADVLRD